MTGNEIRQAFLAFFEQREHRVVTSAPLVPERDPTLMFTNAGMVPFKRLFLGEETRDYTRATTSQKCMRVSGKHNDLENVGRTPRHHTFFEMLGNFSFGDYFKAEAIAYGWEFLTNTMGISPEQLVVSIFREDDEAFAIWHDQQGVPEERIFRLDEKENFWQMGDTGPCGPCSEIHLICGPVCDAPKCDPSCECGRYLEIWNLVFMQFDQAEDGTRTALPKPSIDTGMGLERLAMVMQGVKSNYDTDLFQPIIQHAAKISGHGYGDNDDHDVSLRVIADHVRACTFLIGDGVLPSNEGRGYVLRRVLRRAARHGVLLGVEEPFLCEIASTVVKEMGGSYPELVERLPFIQDTLRREEERFLKTLSRGLQLLDDEIKSLRRDKRSHLSGEIVFKLYDTFGFPIDLTEDILRGEELAYDRPAFDACMREQAERARAAWKGSGDATSAEVYNPIASRSKTRFVGYEDLEAKSKIVALIRGGKEVTDVAEGDRVEIAVEVTPFYAESGGQVGDSGWMEGESGKVEIEDTQSPIDGIRVHVGRVVLGMLRAGEEVALQVDPETRSATIRNHSGTHLFHWALRKVLGPQVTQAGSLVSPERLRFDFTYDDPLTTDQIEEIENLVNRRILENAPATVQEKGYQEAVESGAIAIFEEKYGDRVRVVSFGDFSTELCGGTHTRSTGDIGAFRVIHQTAVGSGVRRIEARTGLGVLEYARNETHLLNEAAGLLGTANADLPERIRKMLKREKELEKELEKTRAAMRRGGSQDPLQNAREIGGMRVVASEVGDANPKELRALVDELKQRIGSGVIFLACRNEDKVSLAMGVTKDLIDRFQAGALIKEIAGIVDGSGGGRPDFAQAGGSDASRLEEAMEKFVALVEASA